MEATNGIKELLLKLWKEASKQDRRDFMDHIRGEDERVKKALLAHYATGRPQRFYQLDGFCNVAPGDVLVHPDNEGDCVIGLQSWELRHSGSELAVRIWVHADTTPADAVRLVAKSLDCLKRDGLPQDEWPEPRNFPEPGDDLPV